MVFSTVYWNFVCSMMFRMPTLTRKNDLIAWMFLSEVQQKIYNEFSHSEEVKAVSVGVGGGGLGVSGG